MNIKEFLVENYIYIIIVIILAIITIIGFLADKKKNGEKRPNTMGGNIAGGQGQNMGNMSYQQPISYQPVNNVTNNGQMTYGNTPTNIPNNNIGMNMPTPQSINNIAQTPQSINNNQNFNQPQIMNMPTGQDLVYNAPQPVEPISLQPTEQYNQGMVNSMMPTMEQNMPNIGSIPQPIDQLQQNVQNNTPDLSYQPLSEQKPTFAPIEPNVNIMNNSGMDNNYTVQPMMEPTNNVISPTIPPIPNQMPMNQPFEQATNVAGTPMPNPVPGTQTQQPVNFVYGQGGQNNNNPYMQ